MNLGHRQPPSAERPDRKLGGSPRPSRRPGSSSQETASRRPPVGLLPPSSPSAVLILVPLFRLLDAVVDACGWTALPSNMFPELSDTTRTRDENRSTRSRTKSRDNGVLSVEFGRTSEAADVGAPRQSSEESTLRDHERVRIDDVWHRPSRRTDQRRQIQDAPPKSGEKSRQAVRLASHQEEWARTVGTPMSCRRSSNGPRPGTNTVGSNRSRSSYSSVVLEGSLLGPRPARPSGLRTALERARGCVSQAPSRSYCGSVARSGRGGHRACPQQSSSLHQRGRGSF